MITFKASLYIYHSLRGGGLLQPYRQVSEYTIGTSQEEYYPLDTFIIRDFDNTTVSYDINNVMNWAFKALKALNEQDPTADWFTRGEVYFIMGNWTTPLNRDEVKNYIVYKGQFNNWYFNYNESSSTQHALGRIGTAQINRYVVESSIIPKLIICKADTKADILTSTNTLCIYYNTDELSYEAYATQSNGNQWNNQRQRFHDLLNDSQWAVPDIPTPSPGEPGGDPLGPGGTSKPGGGDGDFNDITDIIPPPNEWNFNPLLDSGMAKLYSPTPSELTALSTAMWSQNLINSLKNIFTNISDGIISLGLLPIALTTGASEELKFGYVGTGVSMKKVTKQNVLINMGSVLCNKYWGSALDYSPYTKVKIFLPFIGYHDLNVDDIMNKTLTLYYNIDVVTGDCVALLEVTNNVVYSWSGNMMMHLPVSARSFENLITGILQTGSVAVSAMTGGGAVAALGAAVGLAGNVMKSKPNIAHGGSVTGVGGFLDGLIPYLYLERPRQSLAEDYNEFVGYPSNLTMKLGDCEGFTQVENVHLEDIPATDSELKDIERLLMEGVIL